MHRRVDTEVARRAAPITSIVGCCSNPASRCRRPAAPWESATTPGCRAAAIAWALNVERDAPSGDDAAHQPHQRALGDQPLLDGAADTRVTRLPARCDAVLAGHQREQGPWAASAGWTIRETVLMLPLGVTNRRTAETQTHRRCRVTMGHERRGPGCRNRESVSSRRCWRADGGPSAGPMCAARWG